jgi:predicted nucleic acid-binding protein
MIIVSDSGPLISLAKINKFSLLKQVFKEIIIPEGVYIEVVEEGRGKDGAKETREALGKWVKKVRVKDSLAVQLLLPDLKRGETESIVLAKELNADLILIDDRNARDIAEASGLIIKGTVGILLIAKEMGIIKEFKKVVDELRNKGFYLKDNTYNRILKSFRGEFI